MVRNRISQKIPKPTRGVNWPSLSVICHLFSGREETNFTKIVSHTTKSKQRKYKDVLCRISCGSATE